jgi:hypothetical protein
MAQCVAWHTICKLQGVQHQLQFRELFAMNCRTNSICFFATAFLFTGLTNAQEPPSAKIEIADEPKAIDPATLVPKRLAENATVQFDNVALVDVAKWIEEQTGMNVFLDRQSLSSAGILPSEPVRDELRDAPVYLLLDRLQAVGVTWKVANDQIFLVSLAQNDAQMTTAQYNVGDLFDANFLSEHLRQAIVSTIAPPTWQDEGGAGGIEVLGDVLFVRQSYRNHRRVAGLLAALRKHGRRTIIDDPAIHESIRQALEKKVAVQFRDKPLITAVDELKTMSGVDLKLDGQALEAATIPERLPVTFELSEQTLRTVLDLMLPAYGLSWQIRDGALWITTPNSVVEQAKTGVFDVRDLCRDFSESEALKAAIQSQTDPESWDDGAAQIEFPIPGVMIVYQTEKGLDNVSQLLENYRIALRGSKRRVRPGSDPKAMITQYYRMPSAVADDLEAMLPILLQKESWKSDNPNASGTIRKIRSWNQTAQPNTSKDSGDAAAQPVAYSVLIIYQSREIHEQIPEILWRIQHGDNPAPGGGMGGMGGGMGGMGGGMGGMGGGFGGGFF